MTSGQPGGDPTFERHESRTATVRRAPRIGVFIGLGAILGIIVTVAVTTSFPADPNVGMGATVAYMSLYGVTAGVVLGAVVGLILDRVSRRRTRVVEVERGKVSPEPTVSESESASESAADSTARAPEPDTD